MGKVKAANTHDGWNIDQETYDGLIDGIMSILGRDDRDEARGNQVFDRIAKELIANEPC